MKIEVFINSNGTYTITPPYGMALHQAESEIQKVGLYITAKKFFSFLNETPLEREKNRKRRIVESKIIKLKAELETLEKNL